MRTNTTKAKLAEGKFALGAIINGYAPDQVELFGAIGYDFVMIDCEHGAMSVDQVENMVRAAEVFGITPFARIPNHEDSTILRFLDRGVQGIIVPHINTREQADSIARAARYQPEGHRGAGGGRSQGYGVGVSRDEALSCVNSQVMVIPMCEEVEAVDNLGEILTVAGVDMLHVALGDLSQSMGNPPQAEVRALMNRAVQEIHAAGKLVSVGGNTSTQDGVARLVELIELGANAATIGASGFMRIGADEFRKKVEAAL